MMNNIINLTKIFLIDYYQNNLLGKNNKINKKNILFWLVIIYSICMAYVSNKILLYLNKTENPEIFLKILFPIITFVIIIQLIGLTCNIFYYSKDLKYILPLPIKSKEILIAKFNTIMIVTYFSELIFLGIPLIFYGILIQQTITYFLMMILSLLLLPIIFASLLSIIMLFAMKFASIIKNKDIFQIIIISAILFTFYNIIITYVGNIISENINIELNILEKINYKIDKINKIFFVINPIIKIMINKNIIEIIKNITIIIIPNILLGIIFYVIGNKLYLNNVIKNIENLEEYKMKKNKKYKIRVYNKNVKYLINELRKIIKNPTFFIQYILQYFVISIFIITCLNYMIPVFLEQIVEENMIENIGIEYFKLQIMLITVGIMQMIFTFCNLSITSISREGKEATFMKYIPMSLYNQFSIKALPQILMNIFIIIGVLFVINNNTKEISNTYYIMAFVLGMIINIFHSNLMLLIDVMRPNLNWTNKESIGKMNENKLFQYVYTIIIILIFGYFIKVLKNISFITAMIIISLIFVILYIILKIIIKKDINHIFKKIY